MVLALKRAGYGENRCQAKLNPPLSSGLKGSTIAE